MHDADDLHTIEVYLSELHHHLHNYGINRNRRMEHVEQAADILLESRAHPEDELGPSLGYATRLAEADGSTLARRHPWYRAATGVAGLALTFVMGVQLLTAPFFWHSPIQIPLDQIGIGALIAGWFAVSVLRVRQKPPMRSAWRLLLAVLVCAALAIALNLIGDRAWTGPTTWKMLPLIVAGAATGAGLIWYSGWGRIATTAATTRFWRRESSVTYDLDRWPQVEVYRRQPPPPAVEA